ncbi:hypothetical protein D4638_26045 [Escherichia coli]|nr:hypothetical protein [Escherichia coli]EEX0338669.1 hypothetical protein [Escherichia coli]EEX0384630.1 hypothetical protein [Escherichia coli]
MVSIKNDGHYFCRAGGNRPDGLNEPVTYETGYAFLKALLRTRLRLKRTDPAHSLLPLISSSVEALRAQLKENEAYVRLLIGMDAVSRWTGPLFCFAALMILILVGTVFAHVWF